MEDLLPDQLYDPAGHDEVRLANTDVSSSDHGRRVLQPKANMYDNNNYLFKGMPINLDNSGCLDLISTSDSWMDETATKNYLYSLVNIKCD